MICKPVIIVVEERVVLPACTGCSDTLGPPPQPNSAKHIKTIYFHDPISIPDYHASFHDYSAIDLLPVSCFMCQG